MGDYYPVHYYHYYPRQSHHYTLSLCISSITSTQQQGVCSPASGNWSAFIVPNLPTLRVFDHSHFRYEFWMGFGKSPFWTNWVISSSQKLLNLTSWTQAYSKDWKTKIGILQKKLPTLEGWKMTKQFCTLMSNLGVPHCLRGGWQRKVGPTQMTVTNTIHKGQSSCMTVKGRGPHLPLTGFLLSRVEGWGMSSRIIFQTTAQLRNKSANFGSSQNFAKWPKL